MAFASNVDLAYLSGQFVDYEGTAIAGQVKFKLIDTLTNAAGDQIVVPSTYTGTLDANGSFTVALPVSNDADLSPTGYTYTVEESFTGGSTYQITVPKSINLHTNPSLDRTADEFALEGSSTITRLTSGGLFGPNCLQSTLANTATTSNNVATFNTSGYRMPVRPSTQYTVSVYVKLTTGSGSFRIRTVEYNVNTGGTVVAQATSGATALTTSSGWTRLTYTVTTNAGTSFLVFKVECSSGAASQVVLIDGLQVEPGATATTWHPYGGGRTNLITNPSFEVDTTGWSGINGGTIARLATDGARGTACLEVTKAAVGASGALSGIHPVTANTNYSGSAFAKIPSGGEASSISYYIDYYTAGSVYITTSAATAALTSSSGWTRITWSGTTPSNAAFAYVYVLQITAGTAGQKFLTDAVVFERASDVGNYFDGSLSDAGWTGTANASTSVSEWDLADLRPAVSITPYIALASGGQYNSLNSRVTTQEGKVNTVTGTVTGALAYAAVPFIYSTYDAFGPSFVYLPGTTGNYLSTPDAAALDITGDIDLRVQVALDDWTPSAISNLIGKWNSTGNQRSYALDIQTTGRPRLVWSTDGATSTSATATAAPTAADGAVLWIRATLDVDNGAGGYDAKFYTSTDGSSWVQLGSTVTGGATTSIFSGTADVQVGVLNVTTSPAAGKFYAAQVYNGIAGTKVLDVDTSVLTSTTATTFTAATGQTVTINQSGSPTSTVNVGAFATYTAMAAGLVPLTLAQTQAIQTYLESTVVATPSPPGALRRNLVDNPSFEVDTTGWTNTTNCTAARVTTDSYAGSASLQLSITSTTASATQPAPTTYPTQTNYYSSVTAGTTYTASYQIKATSGTPTFRATIRWYDSSYALLSSSNGTASATTTSWASRSVSAAAPANAVYAAVVIDGTVTANTNVVLADAVMLEAQSSALAYFDGSTPGAFWLPTSSAGNTESVLDVNYRSNLVPNPSFEVDATQWNLNNASAITRLITDSATGYTAAVITCNASASAGVFSNGIAITAGQTYTFSIYVKDVNTAVQWYAGISWFRGAGVVSLTNGTPTTINGSTWTRVSVTGTAAATSGIAYPFIYTNTAPAAAGRQAYIDGALFEQASSVKGFITTPIYDSGLYARDAAQAEQAIATEQAAIVTTLIGAPLASDYYPHPFAIPIS